MTYYPIHFSCHSTKTIKQWINQKTVFKSCLKLAQTKGDKNWNQLKITRIKPVPLVFLNCHRFYCCSFWKKKEKNCKKWAVKCFSIEMLIVVFNLIFSFAVKCSRKIYSLKTNENSHHCLRFCAFFWLIQL